MLTLISHRLITALITEEASLFTLHDHSHLNHHSPVNYMSCKCHTNISRSTTFSKDFRIIVGMWHYYLTMKTYLIGHEKVGVPVCHSLSVLIASLASLARYLFLNTEISVDVGKISAVNL